MIIKERSVYSVSKLKRQCPHVLFSAVPESYPERSFRQNLFNILRPLNKYDVFWIFHNVAEPQRGEFACLFYPVGVDVVDIADF